VYCGTWPSTPCVYYLSQEEQLKVAAVAAKKERERREASASVMERVALNAQQAERKKELQREQVKCGQTDGRGVRLVPIVKKCSSHLLNGLTLYAPHTPRANSHWWGVHV
jgi:hypothetical protein